MMRSVVRKLVAWLVVFAWVYLTCLFFWLGLYLLTGDRWWSFALLTALAHWMFWPLLGVVGLAIVARRRSLWAGVVASAVAWLLLFGGLFNFSTPTAHAAAPTIRAMTYNVEFRNTDVDAVTATILAADADVVGLQEINPTLAGTLGPALEAEYPYQLFAPSVSVDGMGVLSRYPIQVMATEGAFDGFWIGGPQVVEVALPEGSIMVMNAHFAQGRQREANAAQVAGWATAQAQPVVVVGDMNATDLSDANDLLKDAGLRDAWREVGWGYGSTFPAVGGGADFRGTPIFVPGRLVRIDYVFCTGHLAPLSVERLPWDGESDHLAVAAEFGWVER